MYYESLFFYFYSRTSSIFFSRKNSFINEVRVLWIACMNSSTYEKIYKMAKNVEFFYVIALVIISIESPIIRQTKVVTLSDMDEKKLTFGKRQSPRRA